MAWIQIQLVCESDQMLKSLHKSVSSPAAKLNSLWLIYNISQLSVSLSTSISYSSAHTGLFEAEIYTAEEP